MSSIFYIILLLLKFLADGFRIEIENYYQFQDMKRSAKIIILLAIILLSTMGLIVIFSKNRQSTEKISIVTTNFPAYDFARAVSGDKATIKMLVKPGTELHDFEPSPQDIISIENCDLFVYTGGESDEWVEDILKDLNNVRTLKMLDSVEAIEEEIIDGMEAEEEESDEPEYDEHVWTSLKNAQKIASDIKKILAEISPENADYFEEKATNYNNQLSELDTKFQKIVDSSKRKTLVFGDRFPLRYFVEDYNLQYYAAFPGCSEQTEASSATIAFLADKVKAENIPVVLKIEMSSDKISQTIADETGAKVLTFNSAHNISAEDFRNNVTYLDIMQDNLSVLEEALR